MTDFIDGKTGTVGDPEGKRVGERLMLGAGVTGDIDGALVFGEAWAMVGGDVTGGAVVVGPEF